VIEDAPEFFGERLDKAAVDIAKAQTLRRNLVPGDVTGTLVYLASDASALVTGQTILVDGGTVFLCANVKLMRASPL
jgi:enoyl-[acyl-carrier-protein] reductase (NADH)